MSASTPTPPPSPFPAPAGPRKEPPPPTPISPLPLAPASGEETVFPEPLPPSDAAPPGATPGVLPPPAPETKLAVPPPRTVAPASVPSAVRKAAASDAWRQGWKRSGMGLLLALGLFAVNALWDRMQAPPPSPPYFPAAAWKEQGFEGIFVTAPLELGPTEAQSAKPREEALRGAPREWKSSRGTVEGGAFLLHLMRMEAPRDPPLQAELLTQSLAAAIAYRMGDPDPRVFLAPEANRGGDAWRGAYRRSTGPEPTCVEVLGLRRGDVYWYVQVVFVGDRFRTDAKRLLDSVRIADGG